MGQTITSIADMVSYAGDLRRTAKQTAAPELAEKIKHSADQLEKHALQRVGQAALGIGLLLDTIV